MNDTERYLRRATRGTWGRKRAEIREELAAHIDERVAVHRIGGLGENEAVEKALSELGAAGEVSAGMMRLHSMPTLLGSSLLCIFAIALFLTSFSESVAQQLNGSFIYPARDCVDSENLDCNTLEWDGAYWVSEGDLNSALEPQGASVEFKSSNPYDIVFSHLSLPDGERVVTESLAGNFIIEDQNIRRDLNYISLWDILADFAEEMPSQPLSISGWEQPSINLGELELGIMMADSAASEKFYQNYLAAVLNEQLLNEYEYYGGTVLTSSVGDRPDSLKISLASPEEAVYGLVSMTLFISEPLESEVRFNTRIARPNADGELEFPASRPATTFLDALPVIPERHVSILVKLAGGKNGEWYETVPPEDITVN